MGRLQCEFRPCLVGVFISGETRLVPRAVDAMGVTRAATKGHIPKASGINKTGQPSMSYVYFYCLDVNLVFMWVISAMQYL